MEKIEFKVQIADVGIKCLKQKIEFKNVIMTPRQVGQVTKLKRDNQEEYVKMTIKPGNEELKIEPIISPVFIDNIGENDNGTYFRVSEFKLPENQTLDARRYVDSKADVVIVLEQLQEKIKVETEGTMFDERGQDARDTDEDGFESADDQRPATNDSSSPKDIELKLPPKWGVRVCFKIGKVGEYWQYGFIIKIGNIEKAEPFETSVEYDELDDCTLDLSKELDNFINGQENFKQVKPLKKKIEKAIEDWKFDNT